MNYLLLLILPLVMSGVCFALRRQQLFALILAIVTTLLLGWITWRLPIEQPVTFFGISLTVRAINRLFLLALTFGLSITLFVATRVAHGENFVVIALLLQTMLTAILLVDIQTPFLITLVLLASALAIVLALVDVPLETTRLLQGKTISTGLRYLVLMLLAGLLLALCFVLADIENTPDRPVTRSFAKPLLALLMAGIGLRLAVVPFHGWLPDLLEDAPPLVGVLISAINIAALLFLVSAFQFLLAPGLLGVDPTSLRFLRIFALASAVLAALLAIHERGSLRRFLGMLLVSDSSVMLFGILSSTTGLTGALFHAFNHVIIGVLLWTAVALLERPEPSRAAAGDGWLRRRPWASGAFIGGVLALIGVPPFNGFASRAMLYQGAAQQGTGYVIALLITTMLAVYAFGLVVRDHFVGRAATVIAEDPQTDFRSLGLPPPPPQRSEPRGATAVAFGLLLVCIIIGLYPPLVLNPIVDAVRSLTFVQFL